MTDEDLKRIGKLITDSEERVISEMNSFVNNTLLPQLEEKADKADVKGLEKRLENRMDGIESRLDSIDRKLDRNLDKDLDQDQRLDKIEAVPTIAHQLKLKR